MLLGKHQSGLLNYIYKYIHETLKNTILKSIIKTVLKIDNLFTDPHKQNIKSIVVLILFINLFFYFFE